MNRQRRTPALLRAAVLAALVVVAAACSDGDDDIVGSDTTDIAGPTSSATDGTLTATTDATPTTAGDGSDSSETTDGSDTTAAGDTTGSTTTLPGEDFDGFPDEGDVLSVMGVAHDDVLNVRAVPGDGAIIATAAPTADDLVATGRARLLPRSIWYEVTTDGITGWVSTRFVGFAGVVDDATAEFVDGGDLPGAETMLELGELVAAGFASEDPPSTVVQSVPPTVGDLGEITFDVVGLGDDAVGGYRLHVFATPDENGETFTLKSIERTTFCTRGLTGELCS